MLQGGKTAHQQTSDDDGQRGELVEPMEGEEPSLVRKRSCTQLNSVLVCAMKRWSEGRGTSRDLQCRGGQNFPKSTELRNCIAFRPFFGFPFPCFSVRVVESVS